MGAGAQHYNIGQDGLGKISLYFPTIQEQQKIAGFLSAIDDRISVQNKIIPVKKSQIISLVIEIAIAILSLIGSIVSFNSFSICNNLIKLLWTIFKEVKRLWSQKKQ